MARAPQKIGVVESHPGVVPATIADVVIDHPIRCTELVRFGRETRNHHHRRTRRPCQPGQAAAETNEEVRVFKPACTFCKWLVASLILGTIWNVIPDQSLTMS